VICQISEKAYNFKQPQPTSFLHTFIILLMTKMMFILGLSEPQNVLGKGQSNITVLKVRFHLHHAAGLSS
jgi:hypothetical protein